MAKEEAQRAQMKPEATGTGSEATGKNKKTRRIRRNSDGAIAEARAVRKEPLFMLCIRDQTGGLTKQVVHAALNYSRAEYFCRRKFLRIFQNDSGARLAKALTRQLELDNQQCRVLRNCIEEELKTRLKIS
ncbi:unnamed protein product [Gongylonema pulchrum]|uniref:Uncharacterized protein n=1 Tax=Gongylonema pulchrum TaxID=637853 RepID=A0A183DC22_9BILA|nr:unnamed protein product [Gongylonema pulchrum]